MKTQTTIVVLPTLDGSKETAVARLEAWSTMPYRRARLEDTYVGTLGDRQDRIKLLGLW